MLTEDTNRTRKNMPKGTPFDYQNPFPGRSGTTNTLMGDPGDRGRERVRRAGIPHGEGSGSKVPPGPGFQVYIDKLLV